MRAGREDSLETDDAGKSGPNGWTQNEPKRRYSAAGSRDCCMLPVTITKVLSYCRTCNLLTSNGYAILVYVNSKLGTTFWSNALAYTANYSRGRFHGIFVQFMYYFSQTQPSLLSHTRERDTSDCHIWPINHILHQSLWLFTNQRYSRIVYQIPGMPAKRSHFWLWNCLNEI